jgi:aromatic ring-opening dioxygenase LigB subunit
MSTRTVLGRVICSALLPHAPILVPGIGSRLAKDVAASLSAIRTAVGRVVSMQPDALISPHSPRVPESFGIWAGERLTGSLEAFGFHDRGVNMPADIALASEIAHVSGLRGIRTGSIFGSSLDHGATVPLWFVAEANWRGPIVVLGLNSLCQTSLVTIGEVIAEAAARLGKRVALIASGDMSHRLTEDGPFGFDSHGPAFDQWFLETVRRGDYRQILQCDPELETEAAHDALNSALVALAATGFSATGAEILSYEAPFGVGYAVVILYRGPSRPLTDHG